MKWLSFPCNKTCKLKRGAKTHHRDNEDGENSSSLNNNSNSANLNSLANRSMENQQLQQQQQQTASSGVDVGALLTQPNYDDDTIMAESLEPPKPQRQAVIDDDESDSVSSSDSTNAAAKGLDTTAESRYPSILKISSSASVPPKIAGAGGGAGSSGGGGGAGGGGGRMARRQTTPANMLISTMSHINFAKLNSVAEDSDLEDSYRNIPLLETTELPRGGITIKTKAVGNVQYGIPPETIKDSMLLGLDVPYVYIVPVERFNREMGPALGVNLAEFEFPAYFNFFVQRRRCTLIVDSKEAEKNIQKVFSETLLGPALFRRKEDPIAYQEEDFDPTFPREAIPNFAKELKHFRMMPNGEELALETLLKFSYFETPTEKECTTKLGVPPPLDDDSSIPRFISDADLKLSVRSNPRVSIKSFRDAKLITTLPAISPEERETRKNWTYGQVKWVGDVSTVYESSATPEQIAFRKCKRVEVFKMPGGGEYVMHDVDENNHIVGRARFIGQVRVPESVSVIDFKSQADVKREETRFDDEQQEIKHRLEDDLSPTNRIPFKASIPGVFTPTFHPPSFGVTVLGNSHGFDKSGSTSGYVLWVNGRGVMIDPPPYSSATLEREGIRPRTIVGIILTHCHADHDAGAFQKVLTGSPVVVITTPTIYESFIRKYAALSALSPALLRHSHRYKRAVIGQALRFQGAIFHFTYTLHSIPCVGFRVEWRGRSMVFTGDHMNIPSQIDVLQEKGILTKARADDLRNLPLQETDLLLHESGAPPIHTPLEELLKLPARVKARLYVVHTSALPAGCKLRVAPTGTAGTIRLDQLTREKKPRSTSGRFTLPPSLPGGDPFSSFMAVGNKHTPLSLRQGLLPASDVRSIDEIDEDDEDDDFEAASNSVSEYTAISEYNTFNNFGGNSAQVSTGKKLPLVAVRPTSSTDAWFILNLLSAVPFMSSLSYASTMEVLETARVDAFCVNDIVVPAARRRDVLCVVWEGTCMEREQKKNGMPFIPKEKMERVQNVKANKNKRRFTSFGEITYNKHGAVWYAGDWTGPRSLQPEKRLSGESSLARTHDIVAMSYEGVKVITIEFANLHAILQSGSPLYRKYLARKRQQAATDSDVEFKDESAALQMQKEAMRNLNIIELLDNNSSFRKFSAVQKRHLESLAEGPLYYAPGQRLWRSGQTVDKAFIIVAGTVAFVAKRRNAQSAATSEPAPANDMPNKLPPVAVGENRENDEVSDVSFSTGDELRKAALKAMKELNEPDLTEDYYSAISNAASPSPSKCGTEDDGRKEKQRSISQVSKATQRQVRRRSSESTDDALHDFNDYVMRDDSSSDNGDKMAYRDDKDKDRKGSTSKERFANKVLGRLYSRRANTAGLVFSRGHFLGDVSKMVARLLSSEYQGDNLDRDEDSASFAYGFGDLGERNSSRRDMNVHETIHEEAESDRLVVHSSTIAAGKDGCSVIVFPKSSLIPFLDEYPGLLLCLLGTQVVV